MIDHTPQAMVTALIGAVWPAARSTATPWPFCTTSTVTAIGMTNSIIACNDHCGTCTTGAARIVDSVRSALNCPDRKTASAPTTSVPMIGGIHLPSDGTALSSRNASTMGAAMAKSAPSARTRSTPNRRKTPATIAITIGMGMTLITRRTQPVRPRTRMSTPVAMKAPMTSGKVRCPRAGPTSTVPGIVQNIAKGWR